MQQPLTNEQIWGVPDEDLPNEVQKDYFDYEKEEDTDQRHTQTAGQGEEAD